MNAWFMRSPVRNSSRCRTSPRSRNPLVMPVSAPSSMPPVARATRCEPIRLISMRSTRMTWARVGDLDAEQPLDGHAVGGLGEQRREVVAARHERDALGPGAVLAVLLDAGVQVADDQAAVGHRLAGDLQDQAQHAMRRGVLRPHVDDDALVAGALAEQLVPVAAGDRVDGALGGLAGRGSVRVGRRGVGLGRGHVGAHV